MNINYVAEQQETCCGQQAAGNKHLTCCGQQATCCAQHVACCPQQVARPRNRPRNLLRATCCAGVNAALGLTSRLGLTAIRREFELYECLLVS